MAVKRQKNWLGGSRVDVPHLREIESAVAADFDDLAGKILASSQPIVVSGMTISMGAAVGNPATQLVLNTAGATLLHGTASEPGALFVVPTTQAAETLSSSNPHVTGSFTPNTINYIGIDLVRSVDNSTIDSVKFRSATTKKEFSQPAPLARTLQYRIVISPRDFSQTLNVAPVAEVLLNASGIVQSVTDCRQMMFRLGTGGSVPNPLAPYAWPGGRVENPVTSSTAQDPFSGADKSIPSFIEFFHAMESRLWEVGGGEHWYSQTTDRDVLFVRNAANVFVSNGENFEWTGTNIHWKALSFDFGNSTATRNTINDQLVDSPGLTDLAIGQCIFVDLNRALDNAALVPQKANLATIGTPATPGSRHIIAWRTAEGVFGLGQSTPVGFGLIHATNTIFGAVKLFTPFVPSPGNPVVPVMDADSAVVLANPATQANVVARGITRDSAGILRIGPGAFDTSLLFASSGVISTFNGPVSGLQGISANGVGAVPAIIGTSSGIAGSYGVHGIGAGNNYGVRGDGGTAAGVYGLGGATFAGVVGQGGTTGMGVYGIGGATVGAEGVRGQGGTTGGPGGVFYGIGGHAAVKTFPDINGFDAVLTGRSDYWTVPGATSGSIGYDTQGKTPLYYGATGSLINSQVGWNQMGSHRLMNSVDATATTTAPTNTVFMFDLEVGGSYVAEFDLLCSTTDPGGFSLRLAGPAVPGGTRVSTVMQHVDGIIDVVGGAITSVGNARVRETAVSALNTPLVADNTSSALGFYKVRLYIYAATVGGTVTLSIFNNTVGAYTSTISAGSAMTWNRVSVQ